MYLWGIASNLLQMYQHKLLVFTACCLRDCGSFMITVQLIVKLISKAKFVQYKNIKATCES